MRWWPSKQVDRRGPEPHDAPPVERFDVVVVGAGSAGCVVAARVAQAGARSLLLEAGPDRRAHPAPELLDGWILPTGDGQAGYVDWGFQAEPDAAGNAPNLRRGRLVGGTSHLTRFALRGSPADFDVWEALGNPGWGWGDVLPAFRRLEADAEFGADRWHGTAGPFPITRYPELAVTPVHQEARERLVAAGFAAVADHNSPGAVGVGPMPMSSRDGLRVTTASAYLPVDASPASLTIRADAQVASLILDSTTVTGVRLLDGSEINADRVVLCAGVYGSPAILLRSGIGPAEDLRSLRIPSVADLPAVGANLADHPTVDLELPHHGEARDTQILHTVATFHAEATAKEGAPDLMFWVSDPSDTADPWFGVDVLLLKPRSRGRVWLRSADPADSPAIELPGLREEVDLQRLAEGYRRAREIFAQPTMGDAELVSYVRGNARTLPHVVGTCAMRPDPASGAVVDVSGRVHGVQGLFVADASVIPIAPSGFTQIITIMLAERISERVAG
jgi:choline dehydrogenase-like flavoprotein